MLGKGGQTGIKLHFDLQGQAVRHVQDDGQAGHPRTPSRPGSARAARSSSPATARPARPTTPRARGRSRRAPARASTRASRARARSAASSRPAPSATRARPATRRHAAPAPGAPRGLDRRRDPDEERTDRVRARRVRAGGGRLRRQRRAAAATAAAGGAKILPPRTSSPASGCGSFTAKAPADPDGVAALDQQHQRGARRLHRLPGIDGQGPQEPLGGLEAHARRPVHGRRSSWGQLVSDFQVQLVDNQEGPAAQGGRRDVRSARRAATSTSPSSCSSTTGRPEEARRHPLQTPSPDSFIGPIHKAAAAGHPDRDAAEPGAHDERGQRRRQQLPRRGQGLASYTHEGARRQGQRARTSARSPAPARQLVARPHGRRVVKSCPGMKVGRRAFRRLQRHHREVRDAEVPGAPTRRRSTRRFEVAVMAARA